MNKMIHFDEVQLLHICPVLLLEGQCMWWGEPQKRGPTSSDARTPGEPMARVVLE